MYAHVWVSCIAQFGVSQQVFLVGHYFCYVGCFYFFVGCSSSSSMVVSCCRLMADGHVSWVQGKKGLSQYMISRNRDNPSREDRLFMCDQMNRNDSFHLHVFSLTPGRAGEPVSLTFFRYLLLPSQGWKYWIRHKWCFASKKAFNF